MLMKLSVNTTGDSVAEDQQRTNKTGTYLKSAWNSTEISTNLFVDFKQAYASVIQKRLWEASSTFGIPKKLICKQRKSGGTKQQNVPYKKWTQTRRQAVPSSFQFGPGENGPRLLLAYADDIDVVGKSTVNVKEMFVQMEAEKTVNKTKTKYIYAFNIKGYQRPSGTKCNFLNGSNFQNVQSFKYRFSDNSGQ